MLINYICVTDLILFQSQNLEDFICFFEEKMHLSLYFKYKFCIYIDAFTINSKESNYLLYFRH